MTGHKTLDAVKTGQKIKEAIQDSGYRVAQLQEELNFECPQAIYRWFKGTALPSLDNLYILSKLLGVAMEDLLVERADEKTDSAGKC